MESIKNLIPEIVKQNMKNPLPDPEPETPENSKRRLRNERRQWLIDAGVPNVHLGSCFNNFAATPGTPQYNIKARLMATMANGFGDIRISQKKNVILLYGGVGTGKTHLAVAIMRFLMARIQAGNIGDLWPGAIKYINLGRVYDKYAVATIEEKEKIQHDILIKRVLIVDELDKIKPTDGGRDFRARIIEQAYDTQLPRIFLTNLCPPADGRINELRLDIGDWLYDRLRQKAHAFAFDWESQRGKI